MPFNTPYVSIFFQVVVKVDLELVDCLGTDYVGWEAIPVINHSLREVDESMYFA